MAYEIRIHPHGCRGVVAGVWPGRKKDAKPEARRIAAAAFPGCTMAWDNDTALLVKRAGVVIATVAIERAKPP